ncbi:unnamed protein product [Candida parapsilosis]
MVKTASEPTQETRTRCDAKTSTSACDEMTDKVSDLTDMDAVKPYIGPTRQTNCRVFVDLNSNEVIREYKLQECDYDEVLKLAGSSASGGGSVGGGHGSKVNNDPKRLLRDQNWLV